MTPQIQTTTEWKFQSPPNSFQKRSQSGHGVKEDRAGNEARELKEGMDNPYRAVSDGKKFSFLYGKSYILMRDQVRRWHGVRRLDGSKRTSQHNINFTNAESEHWHAKINMIQKIYNVSINSSQRTLIQVTDN